MKIRCDISMRDIYRVLIKVDLDVSLQPVVVDEYPEEFPVKLQNEIAIGCTNDVNGDGLLLIKNCDMLVEKLEDFLESVKKEERKLQIVVVDDNYPLVEVDYLRFTPRHLKLQMSAKRCNKVYRHAIQIADELDVDCPPILFTEVDCMGDERAFEYSGEGEKGRIIVVGFRGTLYMVHSIAHELRHIYQQVHDPDYYEKYITMMENRTDYLYQEYELDAEAYGTYYLNRLGKNGLLYLFVSSEECKKPSWDIYKMAIQHRVTVMEEKNWN